MTDRSEWSDERLRSALKTLAGAVEHVGIPEFQAGVFVFDRQSRRRRVAAFGAAGLVVTAGVVAFAVARHTPTRFGTPATESSQTVEATAVEPRGLPVVVRGVVYADLICPAREPRCENGVKVLDAAGQAFPDGALVEMKGTFDGTSLHESMPAVTWADYVPLTPLTPLIPLIPLTPLTSLTAERCSYTRHGRGSDPVSWPSSQPRVSERKSPEFCGVRFLPGRWSSLSIPSRTTRAACKPQKWWSS